MKIRRDIFQAIADPNRRAILALLAEKRMNLNAVAENFPISRPAVSKHIKILNQCGVISIKKEGRERFCEANLDSLADVEVWLDHYTPYRQNSKPATKALKAVKTKVSKTAPAIPVKAEEVVSVPASVPAAVVAVVEPVELVAAGQASTDQSKPDPKKASKAQPKPKKEQPAEENQLTLFF